ncbi:phosphonopyruvate hydrolase [Streptomyces shenzhenensis]|uniref:phosphonopyruvate hydrolase n=1 Tax=Streptomyces shenzhenensis TaxID=943815 RepID=UPI0033EE874E
MTTRSEKNRRLREILNGDGLGTVMAAHNPLSALLAEEAGFDAIWGSGFELSTSYAVPDANILAWNTHLDLMRAIADRTGIPLVADIDTGFGNAVNVSYLIPMYEAAGVSAVVIEDKNFPKDTSLRVGGRPKLISPAEFSGKIEAAVAARQSPDFTIIARTEALNAGLGQEEAIRRGLAYVEAGADALLIHSKQPTSEEIISFVEAWPSSVPLVIVPTAFPELTEEAARELGKIRLVIYGNHAVRAAIGGMRDVFARIRRDGGIHTVTPDLPATQDVIELAGDARMRAVEARFLR